ncbi:MAG: DUF805 domain-containing protein [Proteobacteria bacterium]|nr:DUF805 domain-containing protein [Pseudomonadota bacterium]
MEYMVMPLKRYADFQGRSRRKDYWLFYLFEVLVSVGLMLVGSDGAGGRCRNPVGVPGSGRDAESKKVRAVARGETHRPGLRLRSGALRRALRTLRPVL